MIAALFANARLLGYSLGLAAFLAIVTAAYLEHRHLVADLTKTADAAGYARAVAEDQKAMTAHLAQDAADKIAAAKLDQEIIDGYDQKLASAAKSATDNGAVFHSLRVCHANAVSAANPSSPLPSTGPASSGSDGASSAARSGLPSLDVAGAELSRCDAQSAQLAALQQWVAAHYAKGQRVK